MKRTITALILTIMMIALTGCGTTTDTSGSAKGSSDQTTAAVTAQESASGSTVAEETSPDAAVSAANASKIAQANDTVDYDLTNMSSDMVYAIVYQMMVNPDSYVGKVIRMDGTYYASYYEPTAKYYHYCLIQDAASCCAQGIEFVWGDGSYVYPDEYPQDETEIVVQGTFETYTDEETGTNYLYCRLNNATLETVA